MKVPMVFRARFFVNVFTASNRARFDLRFCSTFFMKVPMVFWARF
jgi:hypothetical protein